MFTRPLTAVPAQRSSQAKLKAKVWAVLGLGVLCAVSGLFATVAWVAFTPDVPEPGALVPQGTAVAGIVADDYLAGRATSVPVADSIDPTFGLSRGEILASDRQPLPVTQVAPLDYQREVLPLGDDGTQTYEIHSYLVATRGRLLQLHVTVLLTPEGPVLAAQPSLEAYVAPAEDYEPVNYEQLVGSGGPSLSAAARAQVERWADAFAAGDGDALRTVAGDQVSRGRYAGLGGFSVVGDVRIETVVPAADDGSLIVRVGLLLADDSAQGVQVSADHDLLVADADSELPKVVAWGPAGTPTLDAYQNNRTSLPSPTGDTP